MLSFSTYGFCCWSLCRTALQVLMLSAGLTMLASYPREDQGCESPCCGPDLNTPPFLLAVHCLLLQY